MRGMAEQSIVDRVEDSTPDKEKKKRRRSRRSKHNLSSSACSLMNEISGEQSQCSGSCSTINYVIPSEHYWLSGQNGCDNHDPKEYEQPKACEVAFSSLPAMHISEETSSSDVRTMQNQDVVPSDPGPPGGKICSKSCPEPASCSNGSFAYKVSLPRCEIEAYPQRKYFAPHWSMEFVTKALQESDAFKAVFRVNAHNSLEAYCTIDGVKTDVLISGIADQNRAVEGDVVAITIDALSLWPRMKGPVVPLKNSSQIEDSNIYSQVNFRTVENGSKGKAKVEESCFYRRNLTCLSDLSMDGCPAEGIDFVNSAERICAMIDSNPTKRPAGKVVAILEKSPRRDSIVGFLSVNKDSQNKDNFVEFIPTDPRFSKMMVYDGDLPESFNKRFVESDSKVEMELVAARIKHWGEENLIPQAQIIKTFGKGGDIGAHINAILLENSVNVSEFSPESLSCLPDIAWEVPKEELETRRDLRNLCIFTVDPSAATDLDDALSVEALSNGNFRVGVHIADVSYFVQPNTPLDEEARVRSTSVYMLQDKLPMLPPLLSENIGSLIPGVDRLAFSIIFDIDNSGEVIDRWVGRTVIKSCCKLSYETAQAIIDGSFNMEGNDVITSVKTLDEISRTLKKKRFDEGALWLDSSKIVFLFDELGFPYDIMLSELKESNFIIEEFMLLANKTAAEIISRAYPDCALLRRHPEPNSRKLKEFELFCAKHGLELDTSSSGHLHRSLEKIREKLQNDSVLLNILLSYASKPMQLAMYFCSGELKDCENDWGHYSLAVPLYTHFTSPLRRYPDIVVHRTMAAALEAEKNYYKHRKMLQKAQMGEDMERKGFTGICFDKYAAESKEGKEAFLAAALKYYVPCTDMLVDVAAYCNKRRLASRHVKEATDKLYMWVLLKKKQILLSEARVLGVGPKFMSIYIHKLAIERRIYYDEVEGLFAEWLESTSTLVLNLCINRRYQRRIYTGKSKSLDDVACVVNPCDLKSERLKGEMGTSSGSLVDYGELEPAVFPMTVSVLSTIPVAVHAVGGEDGPLDIGARLYTSSYFR